MKKKQKRDETNGYVQVYQILDARHIHDEELLVNRTGNFMLVHSFLLVAFATFTAADGSLDPICIASSADDKRGKSVW